MIRIGKSRSLRVDGQSRLCAEVSIDNRRILLWFSVDASYADCLVIGRADAFVMALLPTAMRGGHEVVCEDALSERLYYQIVEQLTPALARAEGEKLYQSVRITAPLTAEKYPTKEAVGAVFSGGGMLFSTQLAATMRGANIP